VWNYFRWRILHFHKTRYRKRIVFVFCYSFNVLLFNKNHIMLLCQTPNAFSTVKLALCLQSLCLLLHNNFLVFNIIDKCWKSSHNLLTLSNHNSRSPEGLGFQAHYSASAQSPTAPFWKPNVLGKLQESVLFEMTDKSLRVKLIIVSLLEHNLNQQNSLFHFRSFNSTRKVIVEESFVSSTLKPDIALPNVR